MRGHLIGALAILLFSCSSVLAQQTAGNITGRVLDQQGAAVPGATVSARNPQTGFSRSDVSDAEGLYRLNALPVGLYEVNAELPGSRPFRRRTSKSASGKRRPSISAFGSPRWLRRSMSLAPRR